MTPSATRLWLPVAIAATTGSPAAIASSVTLPNVSVTDGLNSMSIEATARPRSAPAWKPAKHRVGQPLLEPFARRAVADHQHLVPDLAARQPVDRVGEDVEALLHHQPADEADRRHVVVDAEASAAIRGRARPGLKISRSMPRDQMPTS